MFVTETLAPTAAPAQQVQSPNGASRVPNPPARPAPRRWTVDEFEAGIASGFIGEDDAVELLEGIITQKMSIDAPHAYATDALADLLYERLDRRAYAVGGQNPIRLDDGSRPEPDLRVAVGPRSRYRKALPTATEVLWLAEVADSSIKIDREYKRGLYARAGIAEYWIVDLTSASVECYTGPQADGEYATKQTYGREAVIEHALLGSVAVKELFG